MNVFEDLVVELQQENLLESTFIDSDVENTNHLNITEVPNSRYEMSSSGELDNTASIREVATASSDQPEQVDEGLLFNQEMRLDDTVSPNRNDTTVDKELPVDEIQAPSKRPKTGKEFFRKRAMGEVSSLQMVEHVVTGVEREYMKIVPKVFDDFKAKTALHTFLQVDDAVNSEEHATAEFSLMQETEAWCTALAERDRHISVANLRQYCERSRPALSSQALLGLGRFYRNLPYSETVRAKFDFVITRLFSRAVGHEKRVCLFTRDETLGHINTLYSDWSSISLYSAVEDDSNVMLTALSFDDLSVEAENAASFDQLIECDFFGRLRMFKESISELFYAPQVTAAAIDCNIRIGNAYVALIARERQKMDAASVQSKYGDLNDLAVSEATGQTLQLFDLLNDLSGSGDEQPAEHREFGYEFDQEPTKVESVESSADSNQERSLPPFLAKLKENAFSVNKWFLAFAVVLIGASVGLYVWANYVDSEKVSTAGVQVVDVENTALKGYIKSIRTSGDIFYAQMLPVWDTMPKEKQQEVMQVIYKAAYEKGCKQVTLLNKDGKTVGYMSPTHFDILIP